MSTVNPGKDEFSRKDNFKLAQNIAWVIRTLWGAAAILFLGGMYMATLASDVRSNTSTIAERKEKVDAVPTIVETLERIERKIDAADDRQRDIKSSVDKLEQQVDNIEKRDE